MKRYTLTYCGKIRHYYLLPKEEILKKIKKLDPLEVVKKAGWSHLYNQRDGIAGICLETGKLVSDYEEPGAYCPTPPETIYLELFRVYSNDDGIHHYEPGDLLTEAQTKKFYAFLEKLEEKSDGYVDEQEALEEFADEKTGISFEKRLDRFLRFRYIESELPFDRFPNFQEIESDLAAFYEE